MRRWVILAAALGALAAHGTAANAQDQAELPANDLLPLLGLTGMSAPANLPAQRNPEPKLEAVPRAECGPGSRPLDGMQGRVPPWALRSPEAKDGWTCNVTPLGSSGRTGGWKVWRYVDRNGHECGFYDTALEHPAAIGAVGLPNAGVAVLDMSDPTRPVQTELLGELPMQTPHESLNLNAKRGLLAAEMGSGGTAPGLMAIYDVSEDCRHPMHKATTLAARFGHESGWAPDGNTYWLAGGVGLAAVDVTDPGKPRTIWEGATFSHGLSVSSDGNRLYVADPINGHLTILDSSEVQARKPNPEVREISRLTWKTVSIPQNTAPMTIDGKPYVLEFDEFSWRFTGFPQDYHQVGAARIIDVADERRPRVVSNLRLEVNQRDNHIEAFGDPGSTSIAQGYAAHYCAIPREVDPQIVACSFLASGLRIFDIRDPLHPSEVAYYIAPPEPAGASSGQPSNFAASQPAFVPERREVWYTDMASGFHSVRLDESVWPDPTGKPSAKCTPRRSVVVAFGGKPSLRRFSVTVNGKRAKATRAARGALRVRLPKRLGGSTFVVRIRATTRAGRRLRTTRRYSACAARAAPRARSSARRSDRVIPPLPRGPNWNEELARRVDLFCTVNGRVPSRD